MGGKNVISKNLKSILKEAGVQCEEAETGVMWSYFLVQVKGLDPGR